MTPAKSSFRHSITRVALARRKELVIAGFEGVAVGSGMAVVVTSVVEKPDSNLELSKPTSDNTRRWESSPWMSTSFVCAKFWVQK